MPRATEVKSQYRDHMSWRYYDMVNTQRVLHIDGWIRQDENDVLYFVFRKAKAGHVVLEVIWLRVDYTAEGYVLTPCHPLPKKLMEREIGTPWARKYAPYLNKLHMRYIAPIARLPVAGFSEPPSVRLHYVWSDPSVNNPMEGITNLYGMSSRGQIAPIPAPVREPVMVPQPRPKMDKRARSILRTLDRLLQPDLYAQPVGRSGKPIKYE